MVSPWMGDHLRVGHGCCSFKYCKIPEAEKRGLHHMLLGAKKKKKKRRKEQKVPWPLKGGRKKWGVRGEMRDYKSYSGNG